MPVHNLLASPAGVFRLTRNDHPELGRHNVETLGDVLAHDAELSAAAGAGLVLEFDNCSTARQVRRQRATVGATRPKPVSCAWRDRPPPRREALGLDLLGLLEPQQQLIDRQALGPAAEAMTLQLPDDLRSRSFLARSAASIARSAIGSLI